MKPTLLHSRYCRSALLGAALLFRTTPAIPPAQPGSIAVIYSSQDDPTVRDFKCLGDHCRSYDIDAFSCDSVTHSSATVVLTGHSLPPLYVGRTAEEIVDTIQCFGPDLIVLDTCYGFSTPLLEALARRGSIALVIGATHRLPPAGLLYDPGFFSPEPIRPEDRAARVRTRSGARLERWRIDRVSLERTRREAARWTSSRLHQNLQRVMPNLVRIPVADSGAVVLELVPPERF